jgi:hypothetical protein
VLAAICWLVWTVFMCSVLSWECVDGSCSVGVFTEQDYTIAKPRAMLTSRACRWAVGQIRRENASVAGIARQLGTAWGMAWAAIKPILAAVAMNEARFTAVTILGVDEHIWHHASIAVRGPKELTGMVDLTHDKHGRIRARLLDLVPGRSGTVYADWLKARGDAFRKRVEVATLNPFRGLQERDRRPVGRRGRGPGRVPRSQARHRRGR